MGDAHVWDPEMEGKGEEMGIFNYLGKTGFQQGHNLKRVRTWKKGAEKISRRARSDCFNAGKHPARDL